MPDVPPADERAEPNREMLPSAAGPEIGTLTGLVIGVVTVGALYFAQAVLIPVTLAILLSFVLAPLVGLLRSARLPRVPAVLVAVLAALTFVLAVGGLIAVQIASLAEDLPQAQYTIERKVESVQKATTERLSELVARLGAQFERAGPTKLEVQTSAEGAKIQPPLPVEIRPPTPTPIELAQRFLAPALSPLAMLAIVFVVTSFILVQREDLRDRLIRLFGARDLHRTTLAMNEAAYRLAHYFLSQLGINTAFGCIIATGLFVIGVPSAMLWGVLAGLLRFVPYVGAPLAAVFPALFGAAVDPGWSKALLTLALFFVAEPIMGQVVEPVLYGRSTGLSPISVVVAAIFWTWLWGPIGLILSTPLTLCLVVLGRHVDRLQYLEVLLGDQPALSLVESFYQRMLAGDPDEALESAEQLLQDRSLSAYYDEVALKGLQLAARDLARGVLASGQLERIRGAVHALIEDLDEHDDAPEAEQHAPAEAGLTPPDEPPPGLPKTTALPDAWRAEGAVFCLAGRGPLDGALATMLAQLLSKHGLGTHVALPQAVSRSSIAVLSSLRVAMVCICVVEIASTPSRLRYLLRRVRQHFPGVPVLTGVWPPDAPVLGDSQLRAAMGADYCASTLSEAVRHAAVWHTQQRRTLSSLPLSRNGVYVRKPSRQPGARPEAMRSVDSTRNF